MPVKITADKMQSYKTLLGAVLMAGLSVLFWQMDPSTGSPRFWISVYVLRYGLPLFALLAANFVGRSLVFATPILEVDERGVTGRTLFGRRFVPWQNVKLIKRDSILVGRRSMGALTIVTNGAPVRVMEKPTGMTADVMIAKLSACAAFAGKLDENAAPASAQGDFAERAEQFKRRSQPRRWTTVCIVLIGGLAAAAFAIAARSHSAFTALTTRFNTQAIPDICVKMSQLQSCFGMSEAQCEQGLMSVSAPCGSEITKALPQPLVGADFLKLMSVCTRERYAEANAQYLVKSKECFKFQMSSVALRGTSYADTLDFIKTGRIPKGVFVASQRFAFQHSYCDDPGALLKCGTNLTGAQCNSYVERATVQCEKSLGPSLAAKVPQEQSGPLFRQMSDCITGAVYNDLRERNELKPECSRGLASATK